MFINLFWHVQTNYITTCRLIYRAVSIWLLLPQLRATSLPKAERDIPSCLRIFTIGGNGMRRNTHSQWIHYAEESNPTLTTDTSRQPPAEALVVRETSSFASPLTPQDKSFVLTTITRSHGRYHMPYSHSRESTDNMLRRRFASPTKSKCQKTALFGYGRRWGSSLLTFPTQLPVQRRGALG